jgi:hypothetical protein
LKKKNETQITIAGKSNILFVSLIKNCSSNLGLTFKLMARLLDCSLAKKAR